MDYRQGKIVSKEEFLQNSSYVKEEYEGLLVGADVASGIYNIGLEIGENKVLLLAQADEGSVHQKYHELVPRIAEIQDMYAKEACLEVDRLL
ncbi:hypothetical protein SAMN02745221_01084 [Thermosyntropha lipolytica DSM 11003]|uniref:Uncharacterized protein n=1 Tax=Thermosyntropha lipolytica DSM 11003 TaxID=1123382 RepID=A0A1M5N2B8_9FIRM|nr:hypothetical protein [Thermosyntropha lipolytica]SHG83716.1 hypothetical protein SAMN02745221_01084 [Thermosyntropha lipolytica DSM 11003]